MKIRPLDTENIDHVIGNLWNRGRLELDKWGISLEELKDRFSSMIGNPWTFVFCDDYEPCALCFLVPIGPMKWRTCFAATESGFQKIWLPMSLFMTRLSDSLVADGGYIECISGTPDAREWFESMGFKLDFSNDVIDKYEKSGKINHAIGHGSEIERGTVLCADPDQMP